MVKKIFSGSAYRHHLGNYIGAIKNFVQLQNIEDNKCIFCVVDLHAITVKQDAVELKKYKRDNCSFLASGIDPSKRIFNQSLVPAHSRDHDYLVLLEWDG